MKNKTKFLEFIKNNTAGIIGICSMVIAEAAFMQIGYKDGHRKGYTRGVNDVMAMDDDMYDNVKEYMDNNKGWWTINKSK